MSFSKPSELAIKLSNGKWKPAHHLTLIENSVLELIETPGLNLVVNIPPRHGKSEFISKYFPIWYLNTYPNKRIILVSYQKSVSINWSRRIRDLIENYSDILSIQLDKKHKKAYSFGLSNHEGGLYSTGIGGALTGLGADLLIIDDPIKNDSEANSLTHRDKVWEWFISTALTRLEPNGNLIVVMTRWHDDDLTGRIWRKFDNDDLKLWKQISLPAISTSSDQLNRSLGQALWPERFSLDELNKIRSRIGEHWFSALYQQNPIPSGSAIFKRAHFRYFLEKENYFQYSDYDGKNLFILRNNLTIMATCDLAISTKETADYTVVLVFYKSNDNDIFIYDIVRQRFDTSDHLSILKSINQKYKPLLIGIENVQYQKSLIQQALKMGLPIKSLRPDKDKISRALAIATQIENGKVFFRQNSNFLEEFERELVNFPKYRWDDQVDALSYITQMTQATSGMLPI